MLGGTYSTGTISVASGSATVTGLDVLWNDVLEGDELWPSGHGAMIIGADVLTPFSTLTLMHPWPGTSLVNVTYVIVKTSWKRHDVTELQKLWRTLAAELEATGNFIFVEGDEPDPEMGENGQFALKVNATPWNIWHKEFNVWVLQTLGPYGNMFGANNLSECTNDALARVNIGLGAGDVAVNYATRAAAVAATIPVATTHIRTAGYAAAGDGGGALYKKVGAQPTHNGKLQSTDGAWWEIFGPKISVRAFGADPTGVANSFTAFTSALQTARALKSVMFVDPGNYKVDTPITPLAGDLVEYSGMKYAGPSGIVDSYTTHQQYTTAAWMGRSATVTDQSFGTMTTLSVNNTGAHSTSYLKAAGFDICVQYDPSPAFPSAASRDGCGRVMQAYAGAGNMTAHIFGANIYANWLTGTDGTGSGCEINTINDASATANLNAGNTKTGLAVISAGSLKSTCAFTIQSQLANGWFDAINVRADGITNFMLRLLAPGSYTTNLFSVNAVGAVEAAQFVAINHTSAPYLHFKLADVGQSFISDNGSSINIFSNNTGTAGMYIVHGANAWSTVSDARLSYKKTARPLSVLDGVDAVQLYENEVEGRLELFVKAQEFNAAFPHLVKVGGGAADYEPTGASDPLAWGVSYDRMGAVALQAIKELKQQVAALTARIEQLESGI